jgi:hypothetical protein
MISSVENLVQRLKQGCVIVMRKTTHERAFSLYLNDQPAERVRANVVDKLDRQNLLICYLNDDGSETLKYVL